MSNSHWVAIAALGLIVLCCVPGKESDQSVKFQQYYVAGQALYEAHCANCHQSDGTGLGRVYPPLQESDFIEKNFAEVICLMRYGLRGEILVNGVMYNQEMKGIPQLTDLEIAEIATYIGNSWNRTKGLVDVAEAGNLLLTCTAGK